MTWILVAPVNKYLGYLNFIAPLFNELSLWWSEATKLKKMMVFVRKGHPFSFLGEMMENYSRGAGFGESSSLRSTAYFQVI